MVSEILDLRQIKSNKAEEGFLKRNFIAEKIDE
jgi:hypothetical protein